MMAAVPWAEPGGRFTLSFESHLIELLEKCRTVKGAAALGRITADQMDGVMARAVKRGLLRRAAVPIQGLYEIADGSKHGAGIGAGALRGLASVWCHQTKARPA